MINVTVLPPIVGTEPFCNIGRLSVNGEVVLTNEQAANFYGCDVNNLQLNFSNAQKKGRFVEGKHFFKLEGEDLKDLRLRISNSQTFQISPKTRSLTLLTKLGILRHCKMLNTDKAWEVFELMENTFFNVLENGTESTYKNDFFPPELSEHWAKIKERENDVKGAEVLVKAAKLTSSSKFREHLLSRANSLIIGENFTDEKDDYKEIH